MLWTSCWRHWRHDRATKLRAEPAVGRPAAAARGRRRRTKPERRVAERGTAFQAARVAPAQRARDHAPLQPDGLAQLLHQRKLLSTRQLHDEVQPGPQRGRRRATGVCRPAPVPGRGHRAGRPGAHVAARASSMRNCRCRPRDAPAGGRRAWRVDGPAHDRRLPSLPEGRPDRGPGAGLRARHQPGERRPQRLPGGRGQVGPRRQDQPGRPGVEANPAYRRLDADQPQHLGVV